MLPPEVGSGCGKLQRRRCRGEVVPRRPPQRRRRPGKSAPSFATIGDKAAPRLPPLCRQMTARASRRAAHGGRGGGADGGGGRGEEAEAEVWRTG
jgi:hypothetical protein